MHICAVTPVPQCSKGSLLLARTHPCLSQQAHHVRVPQVQVPQAKDSTTEPGCGVTATVEGQLVSVGRLDWVQQQQARIQSNSSASSSSSSESHSDSTIGSGLSGQSVVYVGMQGKGVVGALGFSDTLRPDSQYVVQQLHSRGIRVVVLSGIHSQHCT